MDIHTRKDLRNISILTAISLILGIYLVATTVVISKDGVLYIERSKELSSHFNELIKKTPPIGFDSLIVGFHHTLSAVSKTTTLESWILSGQICVLTCKILAMIVLYFFGICFFNRRYVFSSLLILTFLPYPTQFGADVLRDWPHILFLFSAMFFLVKGIRQSNWFYLTVAGLTCGLGHIIRPECAQVLLYGMAIFIVKLIRCFYKKTEFPKKHVYLFLLAGFLLIFIPYSLKRGAVLPKKLNALFSASNCSFQDEPADAASPSNAKVFDSSLELAQTVTENVHYYFIFPIAIGFYLRFFRKGKAFCEKNLLAGLFISFNCVILLLLHSHWGYISKRHALPLCIMLSFYIPSGIRAMALYLTKNNTGKNWGLKRWGQVLILAGILICLPKLLRPIGQDKRMYLEAANWIETHTTASDRFLTFDARIPFYGKRENWFAYKEGKRWFKGQPDYLICVTKNSKPSVETPAQYVLTETFEDARKRKSIQLFRRVE